MLKDFTRRLFFRRSTAYFLVSFLSACAQIILRTALFVSDNDGARRNGVTVYSSPLSPGIYSLTSDGGFEVCLDVPARCQSFTMSDITPAICPMLASYVANSFRDRRLEDVVFIILHVYLVLVTIYALARESIPHIIFIFGARCLSAVWALARVIYSFVAQRSLARLVDKAGCGSETQFFGQSFYPRQHAFEAILLGISVLSVALEAYMANKLGHIYIKRPWRVVQVSSEMRRMYRLLLGFSVIVQIAGVVLPATMGLWVDQLLNTFFRSIVGSHIYIYGAFFLFVTFLLPFWIALGWFALRREWKRTTCVFVGLGIVFLCSFIAGFGSAMIIWAFTTWRFFGTLYILSIILLIAAIVLAILCRRNFDKNLDHYLMVQNRLSAMDFTHAHFDADEKMDEGQVPEESESELERKSEYESDHWGSVIQKQFRYD